MIHSAPFSAPASAFNSFKTSALGAVSHLEKVFEQRASKVVSKLGVPTAKDVQALSQGAGPSGAIHEIGFLSWRSRTRCTT